MDAEIKVLPIEKNNKGILCRLLVIIDGAVEIRAILMDKGGGPFIVWPGGRDSRGRFYPDVRILDDEARPWFTQKAVELYEVSCEKTRGSNSSSL